MQYFNFILFFYFLALKHSFGAQNQKLHRKLIFLTTKAFVSEATYCIYFPYWTSYKII